MKKVVALVGVSTIGHHLAFMRLFIEALLDLGHQPLVLFPDEASLKDWLVTNRPQDAGEVLFSHYEEPTFEAKGWGRFNDAFAMRKKWKDLAKNIRKAEQQHGKKVDFVYLTWLDTYLANYLHPLIFSGIFRYPWSGLYFHPRHYRLEPQASQLGEQARPSDVDIAFTSRYCHNVTVHDEGVINKFSRRVGKPVILFPEIADDTPPNMNLAFVQEIQARAKGRTVVIVAGILDRGKRLLDFIEISQRCEQDKFFFVMAGPVTLKEYPPETQARIESYLQSNPENCFIYNQYVKEGEEFNSFIAVSDIIFLIYENFPSSSNRLTKGAIFKKYILTQNRFCTGEDVQKYGLGLTVPEGDLPAALDALKQLRHKILHEPFPTAQFEAYRELHSVGKLKERFREVLARI